MQAVRLEEVNAPLIWDGSRVNVAGAGAWSAQTGFSGALLAKGDLIGSLAALQLEGSTTENPGALNAKLEWRGGRLNATLPAQITDRVDASLEFERFDVAALWNKPKQRFERRNLERGRIAGQPLDAALRSGQRGAQSERRARQTGRQADRQRVQRQR